MAGRLFRIAEQDRPAVEVEIDGAGHTAFDGDTVLVSALTHFSGVRHSEFGDGARAGFCLMGACQDCWMWTSAGERVRACTTFITPGMSILTNPPSEVWCPIAA